MTEPPSTAQAAIEAAIRALEPFAKAADTINPKTPGHYAFPARHRAELTIGKLRALAAARAGLRSLASPSPSGDSGGRAARDGRLRKVADDHGGMAREHRTHQLAADIRSILAALAGAEAERDAWREECRRRINSFPRAEAAEASLAALRGKVTIDTLWPIIYARPIEDHGIAQIGEVTAKAIAADVLALLTGDGS